MHFQVLTLDVQGKHAWRQTQTMWNIKNFAESDPNILNPRVSHFNYGDTNIYRYEFPIMQWGIGMLQRLFGSSISLVRILLFLITAIGSVGFYKLLRLNGFEGITSVIGFALYLFCPVIFYYMINPLPDTFALSAGTWYLYHIVAYQKQKTKFHLILASISLLLATLAKLPFLMFSIVSIYFFFGDTIEKRKSFMDTFFGALVQLLILAPALVWYYWVMPGWEGNGVLKGVFSGNTDWALNRKILQYHISTMFPQLLLYASVWIPFLLGLTLGQKRLKEMCWVYALIFITFLYLILQWDVIGTVHDYYLMPFLPWLYIIVATGIEKLLKFKSTVLYILLSLCVLSAPLVSYITTIDKWYAVWYNKDLYTHREQLSNAVPNDALCLILRDMSKYVFPYQVNKKGYIYNNENLPGDLVKDLIQNKDVHYLYSDSRNFEQKADISILLDSLLLNAGSINVYKLSVPELD